VRQGNKNPLVQLYAYSTKGSYDAVMWQMLASKQRFIDQALSGDSSVRSIDDLSESSQFQIATAMTSDDERAIQLAGLRAEIEKLQRLYRAHEEQRMKMRQDYDMAGETIRLNERKLPEAQKAADRIQDLSGDNFKAKADGRGFDTRKEFGEALMARFKAFTDKLGETPVKIGEISGFDIMAMGRTGQGNGYQAGVFLNLPEPVVLTEAATADPVGVALKATNALAGLSRQPAQMQQRIEEANAKRNALEARITAPFPMAEMLADKIKEAQDLESAMLADQNKLTGIEREQQLEDLWQQKTGAITPLFSRGNGSGMAIRDLSAVVDRVGQRGAGVVLARDAGRGAPLLAAAPVGQARVEEEAVEETRPWPAEPERVRVVGGVAFVHAEEAHCVEAPASVPGDEGGDGEQHARHVGRGGRPAGCDERRRRDDGLARPRVPEGPQRRRVADRLRVRLERLLGVGVDRPRELAHGHVHRVADRRADAPAQGERDRRHGLRDAPPAVLQAVGRLDRDANLVLNLGACACHVGRGWAVC